MDATENVTLASTELECKNALIKLIDTPLLRHKIGKYSITKKSHNTCWEWIINTD